MDTSVGYYQAPRPPRVPLDEVLIRLYPEGFHDEEFEADGINVGPGGLSMRASVLPRVGSTLRCQLESQGGAPPIQLVGEVVWAHDSGPQVGEFGIRFTRLSDHDQNRIEALIQQWGRPSASAPIVRLLLDGVSTPIMAELRHEGDDGIQVEQSLPFLAIGNAVRDDTAGRRGHLEAVELKFNEQTPKLVLSIGYEAEDAGEEPVDRDTLPDDVERDSRPNRRTSSPRLHDTPRIVRYDAADEPEVAKPTLERVKAYARAASSQVSSSVGSLRTTVKEDMLPSIANRTRRGVSTVARFVEALRGRLEDKPRRKQVPRSEAARAHLKNSRRNGRRYVMIAAIAMLVAFSGWGIYIWAAQANEPTGLAEAAVEGEPSPDTEASDASATADTPADVAEAAVGEPAPPQGAEAGAYGAPAPPERVQGLAFGEDQVSAGETYVLRMSNPVTTMDGLVEDDGFSVMIPGSLSLSRAGPIATAHPDVEHAAIHNRGDFSELTIRFVAGRHPAYRVEARGPAVEITIAR